MNNKERNIGIDLLRIVSMCMIIVLHIINKGANISALPVALRVENEVILAFTMCSVNVYVLISSYFLDESTMVKGKKILQMFFECWIINFGVAFILHFLGIVKLSKPVDYLYLLFPFLTRRNWFINVYILLYFLHPFINFFINAIDKNVYKKLIAILVLIFSVYPSIMPNRNWTFDVMKGYDIVWFVCLYLIMSYIKRYYLQDKVFHIRAFKLCFLGLLCVIIMVLSKEFIITIIGNRIGSERLNSLDNIWYTYDSIPVLIMSFVFFLLFYQLNSKLRIGRFSTIIAIFGPCTLGVYMIHDNFKMREVLWEKIIPVYCICDKWWCFIMYVLISVMIFFICSLLYMIIHYFISFLIKKITMPDLNF